MLDRFNLLVSTSRGNERNACREIWYLLNELGDKSPEVDITPAIGLVVAQTSIEPLEAASKIRSILRERPWELRYVLKITPVERIVQADLAEIASLSHELSQKIRADESYRVTVRKRHSELSSKDIIEAVASKIDRRVDLENPDKILLVEIISHLAGLSVITPQDTLAVEKEKRTLRR
jgi:tRNA acetyltransferase TAN1